MKSQDQIDIESEISSLESQKSSIDGQILGLRRALAIVQKRAGYSATAPPVAAPVIAHPVLKLEPEPDLESNIRSGNKRDMVRDALVLVGDKFTPTDISKAVTAAGGSLTRVQITTILSRLLERHEIFIIRNGRGGVEPIYTKTSKIPQNPAILAQQRAT